MTTKNDSAHGEVPVEPLAGIEQALEAAVAGCDSPECAPQLAAAIRHAVFPGGARVRPRLALAVAACCGGGGDAALGMAVAVELLHCASLVHDDLPCFDDAELRRGQPSVHRMFGERIAVLAGDALIVLAFETLARYVGVRSADRLPALVSELAIAAGAPHGIASGQAWESEPVPPLARYQQQKTGALFVAAVGGGAIAAGADPAPWRPFAARLGEAYQVADDIRDVVATRDALGKPTGQDAVHDRPSWVSALGVPGACRRFDALMENALEAIPAVPGAIQLRALLRREAQRLLPADCAREAA